MDRHFFLHVWTYKSNRMGNELSEYVYEKYNHVVVSSDDIYNVKYDIEMKMRELEDRYPRCKPFRLVYNEFRGRYGEKEPNIQVKPDTDTDKVVFNIHADYVRNAILEYRRP